LARDALRLFYRRVQRPLRRLWVSFSVVAQHLWNAWDKVDGIQLKNSILGWYSKNSISRQQTNGGLHGND
jgi:hypothetical protein